MFNDKPCDTCDYFDPVLRGTNKGVRSTKWGWCAKNSVYPTRENPGQVFPAGVKRAAVGERAKPVIVKVGQVVTQCTLYSIKKVKKSKADLMREMSLK